MRLFHFVNEEYALKDIRERRVKIARIGELNDPFEFLGAELSNSGNRGSLRRVKAKLSTSCGILCFAKNWESPVMWGHYADKHRGFCLGFEVPSGLAKRIDYVSSRLKWPEVAGEEFMGRVICTKFKHWSYEEEYRIYVTLDDCQDGLYFYNFSEQLVLKQVIAGAASTASRADVANALGDLAGTVQVIKARAAFRSFRVVESKNNALWA